MLFDLNEYFDDCVRDVFELNNTNYENTVIMGYKNIFGKTVCTKHADGSLWEGMLKLDETRATKRDEIKFLIETGAYYPCRETDKIMEKQMFVITDGKRIFDDDGNYFPLNFTNENDISKFWQKPNEIESFLYIDKERAKNAMMKNNTSSTGAFIKTVIVDSELLTGAYNINGNY